MNHVFISAAHKSSGKTTISIGLCQALTGQGHHVQAFKKGPDYIDPMWLSMATQRPCYNLDFNTMDSTEQRQMFGQHGHNADICLVEGNKGLYDGMDLYGSNSNAALAKLLNSPVVLVIDTQGMTRGAAPLLLGYQSFDPYVNIAGVILNKVGGNRHEAKLRDVIEHYTDIPVLGAVHKNQQLLLLERHLGLIPSNELASAQEHISTVGNIIAEQVDLDKIREISQTAQTRGVSDTIATNASTETFDLRIGIARDAAFGFYYPDDLEAFKQLGVDLVPFDTLHDKQLPAVDGLFIGGGFPETHMQGLHANESMRKDIHRVIESGLPAYAECGGLMYLSRNIQWNDKSYPMVGALPGDTIMEAKPQGRGYVKLKENANHPWPQVAPTASDELPAHEFHYSKLINLSPETKFAYSMQRGTGVNGQNDGIIYKNLLACYTHQRNSRNQPWVERFVRFVASNKAKGSSD